MMDFPLKIKVFINENRCEALPKSLLMREDSSDIARRP